MSYRKHKTFGKRNVVYYYIMRHMEDLYYNVFGLINE